MAEPLYKVMKERLTIARQLAQNMREEVAADLLAPNEVMAKISEAAAHGRRSVVLKPKKPMVIEHTKAAEALMRLFDPMKVGLFWHQVKVDNIDSSELEIRF